MVRKRMHGIPSTWPPTLPALSRAGLGQRRGTAPFIRASSNRQFGLLGPCPPPFPSETGREDTEHGAVPGQSHE